MAQTSGFNLFYNKWGNATQQVLAQNDRKIVGDEIKKFDIESETDLSNSHLNLLKAKDL